MKSQISLLQHSELPLKEDRANFFLEISTAISVFLFTITLAAYFMMSSMIASWNKSIINGLTIQIQPSSELMNQEDEQMAVNKVILFVQGMEGVQKVKQISNEQITKLMSPWLGDNANIEALPIPKLLDVRLKNGQTFDYKKAATSLKEIAPYASIDNHGLWLKKLVKSTSSLKLLSLFVLFLVLSASVFSIFYAVETSLKVHQNIIEILHIMGATDGYVAKQYAVRSCKISFISSIGGTILGLLSILVIAKLSSGLETGLIGAASLSTSHWCCLLTLPLWAALVSTIMSFLCVKQSLRKIV